MLLPIIKGTVALGVLCIAAAGCGGDSQTVADDPNPVEASGQEEPASTGQAESVTTLVGLRQASAAEQRAFGQMWAVALADGVMSVSELEVFALEAVQCTRRSGFKASLSRFDSETGAAVFGVEAEPPDEEEPGLGQPEMEPGDRAADECQNTFYLPAIDMFDQSGG